MKRWLAVSGVAAMALVAGPARGQAVGLADKPRAVELDLDIHTTGDPATAPALARLVSPQASKTMREIFESPGLDHLQSKFVLGWKGRGVEMIRKSGTWRDWYADTAVVTAEGRHYILVALTHHEKGGAYLVDLSRSIDDWAIASFVHEAPLPPPPDVSPDAVTFPDGATPPQAVPSPDAATRPEAD